MGSADSRKRRSDHRTVQQASEEPEGWTPFKPMGIAAASGALLQGFRRAWRNGDLRGRRVFPLVAMLLLPFAFALVFVLVRG
jgi:hypothetical protein